MKLKTHSMRSEAAEETKQSDLQDVLCLDVPLFIRMMELSRENIKSDEELHVIVERVIAQSKYRNGDPMTMDDYDAIASGSTPEDAEPEGDEPSVEEPSDDSELDAEEANTRVSGQYALRALARLANRQAEIARGNTDVIKPEDFIQALNEGVKSVAGPLKDTRAKPAGKYNTKVMMGKPGVLNAMKRLLDALDFTATRLDVPKVATGMRLEINGKVTYVTYCSPSGMIVVSTNLDVIDV